MVIPIDVRTMFLCGALNSVICLATLYGSRSLHRRSAPALAWGIWVQACSTVLMVLLALRGIASDWLSITGGNILGLICCLLNYQAFSRLRGRPPPAWLMVAIAAGMIGICLMLGSEPATVQWRIAVSCTAQMVMAALLLRLLIRRPIGEAVLPNRCAMLMHLAFLVVPAPRLAASLGLLSDPAGSNLMATGLVNAAQIGLMVVAPMMQAMIMLSWVNARLARELRHQASTDELTRLHSRRGFFQSSRLRLQSPSADGRKRALFMLDLDHFKLVNDRFGHQAGDQALAHFALLLRRAVEPNDLVGRYGGEEFCVLVERDSREQIEELASQICSQVRASPPVFDQQPIALTVSIGVAHANADQALEELLSTADRYVYVAKARGRDRWVDQEITTRNRAWTGKENALQGH